MYHDDIPRSAAYAAHSGTSHDPEKRAGQEQDNYVATLTADREQMATWSDDADLVAAEFERYREGYRKRYLAYLYARSRVVSTLIAGGANFPVRRMEKANATVGRRTQDLIDFRTRALAAIRKKLKPEEQPIRRGDSDAVERLEAEIAQLEADRERRKLANKLYAACVKRGEDALAGADPTLITIVRMAIEDGKAPYPAFSLRNLGAKIRTAKQRLEHVRKMKAAQCETHEANGITVEVDPPENRVRIIFPEKPDSEMLRKLKTYGFRRSPSRGCWSGYHNNRSIRFCRELLKGAKAHGASPHG